MIRALAEHRDARKRLIAHAFGAAASYDRHARVQRSAADRLAERIARLSLPAPPRVLEIGAGTGFLSEALAAQHPAGRFTFTDIAPAMLARCRERLADRAPGAEFVVMDGEVPAVTGGFDLITAGLAFQWFDRLDKALAVLTARLAPGGRLVFSTLGVETFREWRASHTALGLSCGSPEFPSAASLADLWPTGGRGEVEEELLVCDHESARDFLAGLKAVGAYPPAPGHRPLAPGSLRRVMTRFEASGRAAATYHLMYATFTKED